MAHTKSVSVGLRVAQPDGSKKTKKVAEIEVAQYDSLEEAVAHEGEERVLSYFNAQKLTNERNAARDSARPDGSKKRYRDQAMSEILAEVAQGKHTEIIGDVSAMEKLRDERAEQLMAQQQAEFTSGLPDVEEEEEEEEDE